MNEQQIEELLEQAKLECSQFGSKPAITVGYDELERFAELYNQALVAAGREKQFETTNADVMRKFAELIVRECVNREELLSAIARGWCSEKNAHKPMDSDLAVAILDEVERQIKEHFGVE
mgnify:CR=1 FL=1